MHINFEKMSHGEVIECYSQTIKKLKKWEIVKLTDNFDLENILEVG